MARHAWDITAAEAAILAEVLRPHVDRERPLEPFSLLGCAAISDDGGRIRASIVVSHGAEGEVLEEVVVERAPLLEVPPELASFRELPALLAAWQQLRLVPELMLVAEAHPDSALSRAAHLGLVLDLPTVGWADHALPGHLCDAEGAAQFRRAPPGLRRAWRLLGRASPDVLTDPP